MDKKKILQLMIAELQHEVDSLFDSSPEVKRAMSGADLPEDDSAEVRGNEAPYLVGAQVKRVKEIVEMIDSLKTLALKDHKSSSAIEITALVEVEVDGEEEKWFFIVPKGGGIIVESNGISVFTLSPESPLGKLLINKSVGDDFEFVTKGESREYEIVSVQ